MDSPRLFEVTLRVDHEDGTGFPAPRPLPPGLNGWWTESSASVKATVSAPGASEAVAMVEALVPELAAAPGVTVTAHAPSEAEQRRGKEALMRFREMAAQADPAAAGRMAARAKAYEARIEPELAARRARRL